MSSAIVILSGNFSATLPLIHWVVPAVRQVLAAWPRVRMNVGGAVKAQAVDMIFIEPHKNVVEDILSNLVAPVIGTGVSPRVCAPSSL